MLSVEQRHTNKGETEGERWKLNKKDGQTDRRKQTSGAESYSSGKPRYISRNFLAVLAYSAVF